MRCQQLFSSPRTDEQRCLQTPSNTPGAGWRTSALNKTDPGPGQILERWAEFFGEEALGLIPGLIREEKT
jgi:hypothetical protein